MSEEYHVINLETGDAYWCPWDPRRHFPRRYSTCLVEPPRPALEPVKQVLKRIGYFAAVLCLTACSQNPFRGEEHIWSGVDDDPRYAANKDLQVVVSDSTLEPLVQYGAEWWAETDEPSITVVASCDETTDLCVDAVWIGTQHVANGDVGGRTHVPAIGRRGQLAISDEVLTVKGMPDMLPGLVVTHELGHALGRGHIADTTELMNPTRNADPTQVCIDGEHCRQYGTPQ